MKKKLLFAMILFSANINAAEVELERQMASYTISHSEQSQTAAELNEFYLTESNHKSNRALKDLNSVFNDEQRIGFFVQLLKHDPKVTPLEATLDFIRTAAITIIRSPNYGYQSRFYFTLVERLDPITWKYIARVQEMGTGQ